jgi:type IV pilus assembly protein PilB
MTKEEVAKATPMKGRGCAKCNNSGYKGRVAVYEVFDFSTTLKEMVLRGASVIELRKQAIVEGMRTLRASALGRVADGRTTIEEALALTMES